MQMHIPGAAEHSGHGHHRRHRPPVAVMLVLAFHCVFTAAAITCFLGAMNRAAGALKTMSRVKVLTHLPQALTDEERVELTGRVARDTLGYW